MSDTSPAVPAGSDPRAQTVRIRRAAALVVDDSAQNRDLLGRCLKRHDLSITEAENGRQALEILHGGGFDLVLLDVMMPEMNGYDTLRLLKEDPVLCHIPVLMVSGVDEIDSVARCLKMGAEDYLVKPINPTVLWARVNACLQKKIFHDREQEYLALLKSENERSERLLLSILPRSIAERLKEGEQTIADGFPEASVLFTDIVGFTKLSGQTSPAEVVQLLNRIFLVFDGLAEKHGVEKIKTIGDAYMAAAGLPVRREDHAEALALLALDMRRAVRDLSAQIGFPLQVRIGINSGPVVAGVIGSRKFIYDVWGDTVNIASRMESQGMPDAIQVSAATCVRLGDRFLLQERGPISVKGIGEMTTYLLIGLAEKGAEGP